jgi:hypothetical protein
MRSRLSMRPVSFNSHPASYPDSNQIKERRASDQTPAAATNETMAASDATSRKNEVMIGSLSNWRHYVLVLFLVKGKDVNPLLEMPKGSHSAA